MLELKMNKESRKRPLVELNLNANENKKLSDEPLNKLFKTDNIDAKSNKIVSSVSLRSEKENEKLNHDAKCPSCNYSFQDPRLLPCNDVVCFVCINFIRDENNKEEYECPICHEIHPYLDQENLPQVKIKKPIDSDTKAEGKTDSQFEQLMDKLKYLYEDIQVKIDNLNSLLEHPEVEIKRYCDMLRLDVDLATEKLIARARSFHDQLFSHVDKYENKCLSNLANNDQIRNKQKLDLEILDTKLNITEGQLNLEHMRNAKISLIDIRKDISKLRHNLELVNSSIKNVNSLLFDSKSMTFLPASVIDTQHLLGNFQFEPMHKNVKKMFKNKKNILFDLPKRDKIFLIEYLPKSTSYAVLTTNSKQLFVNLIDEHKSGYLLKRVSFLQSKSIIEHCSTFHSSANSESKIIFSVRAKSCPTQEFFKFYFFLFDENLNLLASQEMTNLDFNNILSVCLNESSYTYTLWQSNEKQPYLTVYDDKLNYLNTLGIFTKRISEPFYLPSNVESIKTCQDKLVIFGSKQVRVLNGKTGLVEFEYEMKHAKCMWVSNNCYLITFDNKGCFMFFDLNEQKKLGYVSLSKHVYDFKYKHVSNEKLILFNENSFKVHSLD